MIRGMFTEILGVELPATFPRMTYAEAQQRFGSDKPDLRIPLELVDVGDLMQGVEFKIFADAANDPHGRVGSRGQDPGRATTGHWPLPGR